MSKPWYVFAALTLPALGALAGCGDAADVSMPASVSVEEAQQLEAEQKRVEVEEMQHRLANP